MRDEGQAAPARRVPTRPAAEAPARRPRDPRLDFFRGLAMFIILVSHTPGNGWAMWIPARFGFSDATEIFVFCSGMASAIAFGPAFRDHGWGVGTARIGHRVWQVYWAHVGMALAVIALLWLIDAQGWGARDRPYVVSPPVAPFFEDTGPALLGLLSLTWVPNYLDILPMYLVILALVPAVMGACRLSGPPAALALIAALWLAAQFGWMDLPARPWAPEVVWFFNPFGWQLVFFTGFALGMGWVAPPPASRALTIAAALFLLLCLPFAWYRIHEGLYLPDDWAAQDWVAAVRDGTELLWRKTEQGALRWLHFLALAYLAWLWAGPAGARLRAPLRLPEPPRPEILALCALVAVLTAPWVWVDEIRDWAPPLDAALTHALGPGARALLGFDLFLPWERIGLLSLVHLAALLPLFWAAAGPRLRAWVQGEGWFAAVAAARKVGSQSLAVFLASMVLAQANGWWLDVMGRAGWQLAVVNLTGFAILLAVAHLVGWFRAQPWRRPPPPRDCRNPAAG